MKAKHILKFLLLASVLVTTSCSTLSHRSKTGDVPYAVANRYFLKSGAASLPNGAITTAGEFHRLFGEATVMGEGGKPTQVDFKKQFVIAVSMPETSRATDIEPVSLRREDGTLVFRYAVKRGEERSYTVQPLLLIVVDKQYEGTVELQETGARH